MSKTKTWTDEEFAEAVASSFSIRQALQKLKLCAAGCSYDTFRNNVKRLELSTNHFTGQTWNKGRTGDTRLYIRETKEYLVLDGPEIGSTRLKRRLLKEGLLINVCAICDLGPIWNGSPLTLELDHANGNKHDNRLENLRILCPNCHRQQPTTSSKRRYAHASPSSFEKEERKKPSGKPIYRRKYLHPKQMFFCGCGEARLRNQIYCSDTCSKKAQERITWPSAEELRVLVWEKPRSTLKVELGVSDVAIAKCCRKLGIEMPPRGYWAKKAAGKL